MENKSFFQTKAGGLTIAFLVIMVAFVIIMAGLYTESDVVCLTGFGLVIFGILYSPVKVYILDRLKK